jgi:hypothetical protein
VPDPVIGDDGDPEDPAAEDPDAPVAPVEDPLEFGDEPEFPGEDVPVPDVPVLDPLLVEPWVWTSGPVVEAADQSQVAES